MGADMKELLLAFTGSFCAALLFNVKGKRLFWSGISGIAGWMVYIWILSLTGQSILSIFAGAVAVGIISESSARLVKAPSTIFSIPGIFPIVPGIAAYESIQYLAENKLPEAGGKIVETLAGAGAIAFGILLVTALFRLFTKKPQPVGDGSSGQFGQGDGSSGQV
jgi:uncharacterized membrane protein YjjB (DUF3815 family)